MSSSIDEVEYEEEAPDPRVKDELERLNVTSQEINKLELELEHSRNDFRSLLSDSTIALEYLFKKASKFINRARPYYSLLQEQKQAQEAAQNATIKFQRANSLYIAAKEMVMLTEEKFSEIDDSNQIVLDTAWQEMLNHATIKFNDAEVERTKCEKDHILKAKKCTDNQKKLLWMEKELYRSIPKAKSYFERKHIFEIQLQHAKLTVEDLQKALTSAKKNYKDTMKRLECISEELHFQRKMLTLPERTPGVGAEAENYDDSCERDMHHINLETLSLGPDFSMSNELDECSLDSFESTDIHTHSLPGSSLSSYRSSSNKFSTLKHATSEGLLTNDLNETTTEGLKAIEIDIDTCYEIDSDEVFLSQKSTSDRENIPRLKDRETLAIKTLQQNHHRSGSRSSLHNQVLSVNGLKCKMLPDPKKLKSQECEWKINQKSVDGYTYLTSTIKIPSKTLKDENKFTVVNREEGDGCTNIDIKSDNDIPLKLLPNFLCSQVNENEYIVQENDIVVERL